MGVQLYRDQRVFVRELLQNALDACRVSQITAEKRGGNYTGSIHCALRNTADGEQILEVSDRGSGMTKAIIGDFFMRVGRSYYHSFAFRRRQLGFEPISQFGIGILSCFMNADRIEVETRPDPLVHETLDDDERAGLHLEISGPHEYFVVRRLNRDLVGDGFPQGTTVRVYLERPLGPSLRRVVQEFLARTPYNVSVEESDHSRTEVVSREFGFEDDAFLGVFEAAPGAFGYAHRDVEFNGALGFDLRGTVRLFMLDRDARRYLSLRDAGQYSVVGFSEMGETLVNVARMSDEVAGTLRSHVAELRSTGAEVSRDARGDIEQVARVVERLLEALAHRHDSDEVNAQWVSLDAQIDAIRTSQAFRTSPRHPVVAGTLRRIRTGLESFVTGNVSLAAPTGLLTQDGIDLSNAFYLSRHLRLGIAHMFNLDLCGKHRVTLTASRNDIVADHRLDALVAHFHERIGLELGRWFTEEEVPPEQIDAYLRVAPKALGAAVRRGLDSPS